MCVARTFTICCLAAAVGCGAALAQTTTNQPSFRVSFSATCQGFDAAKGRIVTTRMTDRTIVAQATGVSTTGQGANRNFALVFNPNEDSLQVADANGQPVVDVVHFGGGAATADNRQAVRLTFMFFPGQTNEFGAETNVFGMALITERASRSNNSGAVTHANISGKLQFTLVSGTPLGTTNIESGTNVEICTGVFTTGGQFPPTTGGTIAGGTTGTNGATGTTGTNGVSGTNGVGTATTGTTVTPIVIVTTPNTFLPNTTGTTITTFGSTTGMLPSLTGNGSLPGLGTQIGTGQVSLTPFNTVTPVTLGTPVTTLNQGTPFFGSTTTATSVGTLGPIPTPVTPTQTGTTTGTLAPAGSLTGF